MEPEEERMNKNTLSEVVVMLPEEEEGKEMDEGMSTNRLEKRLDELSMKWAGTDYEIVLEKLEMLESWNKSEVEPAVKEAIIEWMLDNEGSTLIDGGEDTLDGLELMTESGEISDSLVIHCTEIINGRK